MNDDDFEWDEAKARLNLQKHALSFEVASEVFERTFSLMNGPMNGKSMARNGLISPVWSGAADTVTYTNT